MAVINAFVTTAMVMIKTTAVKQALKHFYDTTAGLIFRLSKYSTKTEKKVELHPKSVNVDRKSVV